MVVFDAGEALVEALEFEGELAVVDPHEVENRGVEVVDVDGVFGDVVGEVVGFAEFDAAFDAAASHPHGEATGVVVAAVVVFGEVALGVDGAAEFASPNDEGVFQETALFEVHDEGGAGAFAVVDLAFDEFGEVVVLVPAAVEDLDDACAALDEAAGEDGALGEAALAVDVVAIHVEGGFGFFGEVSEFGHAGLHAEGHFVLGDAGLDFGVADAGVVEVVEFAEGVEHGAAVGGVNAGGIFDVEDGVALAAEGDAGEFGGEKAAAPHAGEEGLSLAGGGKGGGEDDEGWEVVGGGAEAVGEPGADGGFARDLGAGHDVGAGGVMIDGGGVDGFDDGEFVDDFGGVGEEFADPAAGFAVLGEFEHGGGDREAGLAAGHGGDALAVADAFREVFVEVGLELGFVVPEVELGRGAVHVEVDEALGFGGEVGEAREGGLELAGGGHLMAKHRGEGDTACAEAGVSEELAAGLETVEVEEGIHGVPKIRGNDCVVCSRLAFRIGRRGGFGRICRACRTRC